MTASDIESRVDAKRILMLAPSHFSWDPRVVMRESRAHHERGYEVAVLAREDPTREFPSGLELIPLQYEQLSRLGRVLQLASVYRKAKKWKPEIVHAHEVESCAVGLLLKWRTGCKLIFDVHECFQYQASYYQTGLAAKITQRATVALLKFLSRNSDHVIVVSYTNEKFYREECGCSDVTLIHNSADPNLNPALAKGEAAANVIVHQGHCPPNRGLDKMMEAVTIVRRSHPVELVAFGLTRENEIDLFEKLKADLGLQDAVRRVGWLPYDELGEAMNVGSIGIMALQPYGNNLRTLHNKLFGYMAAGQAVLGPENSDTAMILNRFDCGLAVDMSDPNKIADAIIELLEDPERRTRMGNNGRTAVENEFGWHKMKEELDRVVQSV